MYISEHTIKKILKEAGAGRISSDASAEMQKHINRMAFSIAQKGGPAFKACEAQDYRYKRHQACLRLG